MEAIKELEELLKAITFEGPARPAGQATRALVLLENLRAEHTKVTEELEEWRFTNKVDELQREVDQLRQQVQASCSTDEQVWSATEVANACVAVGFGVLEANTLLRALKDELPEVVLSLAKRVHVSRTRAAERAAFEAWFVENLYSNPAYLNRRTDDPNTYVSDITEARWIGWQACAESRLHSTGWALSPGPSKSAKPSSHDILALATASTPVPLPEPFERVGFDGFGAWHVLNSSKEREFLSGDCPVFDDDQMHAYGKACAQAALEQVLSNGAVRQNLHVMEYDSGRIGWYFNCDSHYIDVDKDEDGKYSVFFRDRMTQAEAFFDQAAETAEHAAFEHWFAGSPEADSYHDAKVGWMARASRAAPSAGPQPAMDMSTRASTPTFWYDDCAEPRMSDNGLCSLTVSMEGPRGTYDKPLYRAGK